MLQIVTANRLGDGEVVWLGTGGQWVETVEAAQVFDSKEAVAEALALGARAVAERLIVEPYEIDVTQKDGRIVPVRLREKIRATGPTFRTDLGKQAARARGAA